MGVKLGKTLIILKDDMSISNVTSILIILIILRIRAHVLTHPWKFGEGEDFKDHIYIVDIGLTYQHTKGGFPLP